MTQAELHRRARGIVVLAVLWILGSVVLVVLEAQNPQPPVQLRQPYHVVVDTTAAALTSSGSVRGVVLQAICPGQTIYLGTNSAVSATSGWPLGDKDTLALEVSEANQIWVIATASSQRIVVLPYRR